MSLSNILKAYEGKKITIAMQSNSAMMEGILTKVTDEYFIMKTQDFNEVFFDISKLVYFWERT